VSTLEDQRVVGRKVAQERRLGDRPDGTRPVVTAARRRHRTAGKAGKARVAVRKDRAAGAAPPTGCG